MAYEEVQKLTHSKLQQLKVEVEPELHERLKVLAARERTSLRALVVEAVEALLKERGNTSKEARH